MEQSADTQIRAAAKSTAPVPAKDAEAVAEALREQIQANELEAGEWLREARLCRDFDIGRSIARRALRILSDDGLVEIEENRGARVSTTTVEEVFDLYEIRAALYGLAARVACMRATDRQVAAYMADIDEMLGAASKSEPSEHIIEMSEKIFSAMAVHAGPDAQRMIASVRRKTRFHYSYVALALNTEGRSDTEEAAPYIYWKEVRAALETRDPNKAGQAARDILYFMQGEVSRIMLAHGTRPAAARS